MARYVYANETGAPLAVVGRYERQHDGEREKSFRQWHADAAAPNGWKPKGLPESARVLYRLPAVLAAVKAGAPVYLVEGEKCAEALASALAAAGLPGAVTTTLNGSKGKWLDHYGAPLAGARVVALPDLDKPGAAYAHGAAAALAGVAERVCVLDLADLEGPQLGPAGDVADWLRDGGDVAVLVRAAEIAPPWTPPESPEPSTGRSGDPEDDGRPEVLLHADEEDASRAVWRALEALPETSRPRVFVWQNELAIVERDATRKDARLRIVRMTADRWRSVLGSVLRPFKIVLNKDGALEEKPARITLPFASYTLHRVPEWVPVLREVYRSPVWLPSADGPRFLAEGYDAETGALVDPAGFRLPSPNRPTPEAVQAAVGVWRDVMSGFPLRGSHSFAHLLAMALTVAARPLVDGPAPLFAVEAPIHGSGKTLAVNLVALATTGEPAAVRTEGHDEDEWRKRITAVLAEAPSLVCIDNLRRTLDSAALASVLTTTVWSDRLLGRNDATIRVPNQAVWTVTGNNPRYSEEIARRVVSLRLEPDDENPSQRTGFRYALTETAEALKLRPRLLGALHTMIAHWKAKGCPGARPGAVLGSYEAWVRVVGGVLHACGVGGFLEDRSKVEANAAGDVEAIRAFVSSWATTHGTSGTAPKDLLTLAEEAGLWPHVFEAQGSARLQRLGKALARLNGRVFAGWRIVRPETRTAGGKLWRLEAVQPEPTPEPPAPPATTAAPAPVPVPETNGTRGEGPAVSSSPEPPPRVAEGPPPDDWRPEPDEEGAIFI